MFSQIFDYIKKCKEFEIDDSTIYSILKDVGWKEQDINYAFSEYKKVKLLPPPPIPNYDATAQTINHDSRNLYSSQQSQQKFGLSGQQVYTIDQSQGVVVQNTSAPNHLVQQMPTENTQVYVAAGNVEVGGNAANGGVNAKIVGPFSKLAHIFKKDKKVASSTIGSPLQPEGISAVPPVKKINTFRRKFEKTKKVFTIIVGIAIIGSIIWWVVSLKNTSGTIDTAADNERLTQINKIQEGVSNFYNEYKRLPTTLNEVDPKKEYIIDKGSNQAFDYKVISATNFQTCTIFYAKGVSYEKGYTCFPFEVNATGGMIAGLAFNPQSQDAMDTNTSADTSGTFYNCKNPKALLQANVRCSEDIGNCRKPFIAQDFGISSIGLSNNKDKIAQTFIVPRTGSAKELTEIAPYIISYYGNMGCMSIYELDVATQPQSGKLMAEYEIDLTNIKKENYNRFFIDPITLDPVKTYSVVFSLMDNDSFMSFAKGNELSSYYDGSAYYLKRPLEECTGTGCPKIEWIDRQDDIQVKLKFF